MIGYRKVDGQWVEVDLLKIKELRTRASRHRNERIIAQAERAKVRLQKIRDDCQHEVVTTSKGPTYDVTTCVICGKTDIH